MATLLVVEDSPEDFEMIRRGLTAANVAASVRHCRDGDEALDLLQEQAGRGGSDFPALILLDLNLPGTDGRDVLREMQRDPRLATIPVVVFSNSSSSGDINACYNLGANSFIEKPLGPEGFARVMGLLRQYWLEAVRLPCSE